VRSHSSVEYYIIDWITQQIIVNCEYKYIVVQNDHVDPQEDGGYFRGIGSASAGGCGLGFSQ
jgi:hypothetical protein